MQETELTLKDTSIIQAILRDDRSANEVIPENTDADTLREYCNALGGAFGKAESMMSRIKPYLGRVLALYRNHPRLFTELGYKNYSEWMTEGVPKVYGISRPEAFKIVRIAEELGHIDPKKLADLGATKQDIISKIQRNDNSSTLEMKRQNADVWITRAETMTPKELAVLAISSNLVDPGDVEPPSYLQIRVDTELKKAWDSIENDQELCEHIGVGVGNGGEILRAMVSESLSQWRPEIEERKRSAT